MDYVLLSNGRKTILVHHQEYTGDPEDYFPPLGGGKPRFMGEVRITGDITYLDDEYKSV